MSCSQWVLRNNSFNQCSWFVCSIWWTTRIRSDTCRGNSGKRSNFRRIWMRGTTINSSVIQMLGLYWLKNNLAFTRALRTPGTTLKPRAFLLPLVTIGSTPRFASCSIRKWNRCRVCSDWPHRESFALIFSRHIANTCQSIADIRHNAESKCISLSTLENREHTTVHNLQHSQIDLMSCNILSRKNSFASFDLLVLLWWKG